MQVATSCGKGLQSYTSSMEVILFDFFGVLSTPVYKYVFEKYISEAEQAVWIKKLDDLDLGNLSESRLVEQIAKHTGIAESEIFEAAKAAPKVNEELFNIIENSLSKRFTIGLLTNIPRNILERIISDKLPLFDITLVSSDLKLVKPSREIFDKAIEKCAVPPQEILFIDDSEKNIAAAQELGIKGIVYKDLPELLTDFKKLQIL